MGLPHAQNRKYTIDAVLTVFVGTREDNMKCQRCQGPMDFDRSADRSPLIEPWRCETWRCCQCGERIDFIVLHRRAESEWRFPNVVIGPRPTPQTIPKEWGMNRADSGYDTVHI